MVNFNGNLLSDESLFLNGKNRGLRYGDYLTESLMVINGKLIFWEDHYLKLMASMRILRMEIPMSFTMEFLEEQLTNTLVASKMDNIRARIDFLVFRDGEGRQLPESNNISYCIEVHAFETSLYVSNKESYEVELFRDFYVNTGMLSRINSNDKLLNVLGSIYANENDYQDCLLLNNEKMVASALNGNLFLVSGNKVQTPSLNQGCIDGIIRKKIIKLIDDSVDYEFEEASISPFELQKADELFIGNIENGIIPITKYRKKKFVSSVSRILLEKLNTMISQEIRDS